MITVKIWFLLVVLSVPNAPSVKYTGSVYSTEKDCLEAQAGFLNAYEAKPQEYKDLLATDAFCLSLDAFPIKGMKYKDTAFGV
tara:strand:+ start:39 stop:287 length:249 start_codon:yes stop_codon:yes gene_type:complete